MEIIRWIWILAASISDVYGMYICIVKCMYMAGYIKHSYILEMEIYYNMIVVRTFIRFTIFAFIVSPFSHFPRYVWHQMCIDLCF